MISRWHAFDAKTPEIGYWVAESADGSRFSLGWFHLRPPSRRAAAAGRPGTGLPAARRDCWGRGLAAEGPAAAPVCIRPTRPAG